MLETLIVSALVVLLVIVGWAAVLLSWTVIAMVGAVCMGAGLVLGVPTGLYYHLALYRCLASRGVLPPRWWWSPVRYHRHLSETERARVLPWFFAGGAGFVLILIGFGVATLGVFLGREGLSPL